MSQIKVAILIATYRIGGPGKGLLDFCEAAPEYGCEPLLMGFTLGKEISSPFIQEAKKRKLKVLSIKHHFKYDPTPIFQFLYILKKNKVDIIQTHGHKANFIALISRRFKYKPWVSFVHGWTDEDWKIKAYNRLDKYLLKFPNKLAAVSKEMASKLYALGIAQSKVKVIYNAVFERGILYHYLSANPVFKFAPYSSSEISGLITCSLGI